MLSNPCFPGHPPPLCICETGRGEVLTSLPNANFFVPVLPTKCVGEISCYFPDPFNTRGVGGDDPSYVGQIGSRPLGLDPGLKQVLNGRLCALPFLSITYWKVEASVPCVI